MKVLLVQDQGTNNAAPEQYYTPGVPSTSSQPDHQYDETYDTDSAFNNYATEESYGYQGEDPNIL